jgi:hypothetical protein
MVHFALFLALIVASLNITFAGHLHFFVRRQENHLPQADLRLQKQAEPWINLIQTFGTSDNKCKLYLY